MKVFVTGASGFIGLYVARCLSSYGHEMVCLVRKTSRVEQLKSLGARLITGDVQDREALREGMQGCDWLINLANVYTYWEPDPQLYREINVEGTRAVMEAALAAGIAKVVHVSSVVVYGEPAGKPFSEESPVGPERFSAYARSKYAGDLVAWDFFKHRGLPLVVVYPASVQGAGDTRFTGDTIRRLMRRRMPATIFDDRQMTYVHVHDVAEIIVRAAQKEDNIGERYIAGKERMSIGQYCRMICTIAGVKPPRLHLPDPVTMLQARVLTAVADMTKRPPLWGLSLDAVATLQHDIQADGSKAERELDVVYTPVRAALEEAVASFKQDEIPAATATNPVEFIRAGFQTVIGGIFWFGTNGVMRLVSAFEGSRLKAALDESAVYHHYLSERRQTKRLHADRTIVLTPEGGVPETVRLKDISRRGMYVESAHVCEKDHAVMAAVSGELPFARGWVVRTSAGGMAVRFDPREYVDLGDFPTS